MRLYLIGAGVIARTHVAAAAHLGVPVEVRVADPAPAVLADFLTAHPDAAGFASAEAMLAAEAPALDDVVVVATPPVFHAETAIAAARSGRAVLCEKPLAMTVGEAERMLQAAETAGVLFGTCSTRFRGLPHTEAVKRVLASGVLGEVRALDFATVWPRSRAGIEYQPSSRWFLDSAKSGGGVVMDWGPYDVSTLFDLLRPVAVEVQDAWLAQPRTGADPADVVFDVESSAGAALRFTSADGAVVHVAYRRASGTHETERARAELAGTTGALRWTPFDSQQPVLLRTDAAGAVQEEEVPPAARSPLSIFDRPLVEFWAALQGRPSLATTGALAVDEFRVLRAIYDVAATGVPARVEVHR
jgi:predicted dehydrogenase